MQKHGTYQSAAGRTVTYWEANGQTMLVMDDGDITMVDSRGEIYGTVSIEAGLRLIGWVAE